MSLPDFPELKTIDLDGVCVSCTCLVRYILRIYHQLASGIYVQLIQAKRDKVEKIVLSPLFFMWAVASSHSYSLGLTLTWICCKRERKDLQAENQFIVETFETFDFSKFNALKEVQIASVDEWPYHECVFPLCYYNTVHAHFLHHIHSHYSRELKNSVWQNRAQSLINTYGFIITDASGTPWKPRMHQRKKVRHQKKLMTQA